MGYDMHWRQKPAHEVADVAVYREEFTALTVVRDALQDTGKGVFNQILASEMRERGEIPDYDAHDMYTGRTREFIQAQDAVHAAYVAMLDAERSYFRFNMWGMCAARTIMRIAGMVFDDGDQPKWPEYTDFNINIDDVLTVTYSDSAEYADRLVLMTSDTRDRVAQYFTEQERVLSYHSNADTPGIPVHKLCDNSGWIVLPVECAAAVELHRRWLDTVGESDAQQYVNEHFEGRGWDRWLQWVTWIGDAARYGGFEVH